MSKLHPTRSARLLDRDRSLLLVVDVQEKLLPLVTDASMIEWNAGRLQRGASSLNLPHVVTEQYPEKLGKTVASLDVKDDIAVPKRMFSCRECLDSLQVHRDAGREQLVVCGIETHVCILQTVLDSVLDWQVFVVSDAVSSRKIEDHQVALRRMEMAGATLTTVESVLFEWCETSQAPEFKAISQLVRETPTGGEN